MSKAIIIGAGFGGLSLGIRLAAKGFEVEIFEKQSAPGGHAIQFQKDGFTFDMGPSLITAPEILRKIFTSAGKNIEDYIDMAPLDPFYRVYFHDGTFIDYSGDTAKMTEQMRKFSQKDAGRYPEFIEYSKQVYDAVITEGLGATPFIKLSTMAKFVPRAMKLKALNSSFKSASRFFDDFRHQFVFSFHPLFIGGNPFRVPGIYQMISYLEKAQGVWYSKGGMYSLVKAMAKLFEELGGKIHQKSEVQKIILNGKGAAGIIANGETHKADLIISNADTTHTYQDLIGNDKIRRLKFQFRRAKYSMSTYILYLGVAKKYPQLLHHTLILSERYKELVSDIFDRNILPDDFSMYVHVPSKTDATMAPEGSDSIYILVPVTNLTAGIDWEIKDKEFGDKLIHFLEKDFGLDGLEDNIRVRESFTPADFKKVRNSHLGSPWGMEPVLSQSAYFRPQNISEDIENLFLVGAGTHPGAGLPGVMLSAEATEKLILEKFGNGT